MKNMKKVVAFVFLGLTIGSYAVYAGWGFGRRYSGYGYPSDTAIVVGGVTDTIGTLIASSAIAKAHSSDKSFRRDVRHVFDRLADTIDKLRDKVAELDKRVSMLEKDKDKR